MQKLTFLKYTFKSIKSLEEMCRISDTQAGGFCRGFLYNGSMKITLLTVGKIKEACFRDAVAEYKKRLSRFCELNIIEVPDEPAPERASEAQCRQIKEREGEKLLKASNPKAYHIVLAVEGKKRSSEAFAAEIEGLALAGNSHLEFFIGGSLGLSEEVLRTADLKLSFSDMTFPHQLMRVILLEQIYRAFKINRNETYHK